jgi:hypothetical protein
MEKHKRTILHLAILTGEVDSTEYVYLNTNYTFESRFELNYKNYLSNPSTTFYIPT